MEKILRSLGAVSAVIGAQWGDEGKGKIVDFLAPHFDCVARACGGANAGHTIVLRGEKRVFHLLPAGSLHPGKDVVLGSGMVIHLPTLLGEILALQEDGVDILPRLKISHAAHIVFERHKERDAEAEERRGVGGIGTTRRGIGPAYTDKAARTGTRMGALMREGTDAIEGTDGTEVAAFRAAREILAPCITDTVSFLHRRLGEGRSVLIEGAQGTLLDLDHGTYPYVTSSSTTAAGALQGLGLPPRALTSCIGVAKAYCTRVGSGTFPTEVTGEIGDRLRERGGEYGATTGRPRRCGWLSIPDLLRAAGINGFTHWNITKLDVLDGEREIPVGISGDGGSVRTERMEGWNTPTVGVTSFADLPAAARGFIGFIEEQTRVPVAFIGTGPERGQMILRE